MEINEIEQKEFEKQLFCASASIRAVGQIRFNDDRIAKQTIEEIEEEGAIEEIEAIPATQQYRWFFGFVDRTIETQNAILNLYVDFSNYKQRF
ncbi:MAG: hypothetical protein EZS28_015785 [Streblomastix strix]|uniref:Uncharacterized protein n=1 Tax=Streblomastix strix TaxID=222440 RepID=A0A5J4W2E6_9EUKA|nr:MAG: hypothetical protein EZS28_015785 [Streblomastix strix]